MLSTLRSDSWPSVRRSVPAARHDANTSDYAVGAMMMMMTTTTTMMMMMMMLLLMMMIMIMMTIVRRGCCGRGPLMPRGRSYDALLLNWQRCSSFSGRGKSCSCSITLRIAQLDCSLAASPCRERTRSNVTRCVSPAEASGCLAPHRGAATPDGETLIGLLRTAL